MDFILEKWIKQIIESMITDLLDVQHGDLRQSGHGNRFEYLRQTSSNHNSDRPKEQCDLLNIGKYV